MEKIAVSIVQTDRDTMNIQEYNRHRQLTEKDLNIQRERERQRQTLFETKKLKIIMKIGNESRIKTHNSQFNCTAAHNNLRKMH